MENLRFELLLNMRGLSGGIVTWLAEKLTEREEPIMIHHYFIARLLQLTGRYRRLISLIL